MKPLKVAVIEGFHPFAVPQWHELFRALHGVDYYPQVIENWAIDWGKVRTAYDVLLFYNMNMSLDGPAWLNEPLAAAIAQLGETPQGIVMLHHALLAYPDNATWSDVVGIPNRAFKYFPEQEYTLQPVTTAAHSITTGLQPAIFKDETYTMDEPDATSQILFTVEHPKSMHAMGWTRTFKQSRVFCFQPGHDQLAWENPVFREILQRGIHWSAKRL